MEKFNLEDYKKNIIELSEITLARVIDDLYLENKDSFVDYENQTHKLGWFKEQVKVEFNKKINENL